MATLSDALRSSLEKAVEKAREQAEKGAKAALEGLEVHLGKTVRAFTEDERDLRNRLRAHGRQLGDRRDPGTGEQSITHLVWECAYQHWHRMLFARFLAENHVLIHPEAKVAVSLEECADLALEEGLADQWEVAEKYATSMLPQIFRPDHPVLELRLPTEYQRALEKLLAVLPREVFTARDSLGWVYQFWQSKRKDEINRSETKIGADELPAVTQLFTEPYMVDFLLHNTLGAWWLGAGRPLPEGLELHYLRTLEDGTPAAGTFDGWPHKAAELKVLDPCCGSGHFLVAAFDLLVRFRMAEDRLSAREAADAVLRDNLHGLELDERCTQIAAFALALAAWTFPGAGGWRHLPSLSVACSGLSVAALPTSDETEVEKQERMAENKRRRDRWIAAAGKDERKRQGMMRLFDLFAEAPVLGSLVDPNRDIPMPLLCASSAELRPLLEKVLNERPAVQDAEERESHVAARGIAEAARVLTERYHLVATNVPYLTRGKQSNALRDYADRHYPDAKSDLANIFLERCLELSREGSGVVQVVMPQNWLFLGSYRKQRETLLRTASWNLVARLGPGAFVTISGEVVNVILIVMTHTPPPHAFLTRGIDASGSRTIQEKAGLLRAAAPVELSQERQKENPDSRFVFALIESGELLSKYANAYWGQGTGDFVRFGRFHWEICTLAPEWERGQTTVDASMEFGGRLHVVFWQQGKGELVKLAEILRFRLKNIHYRGAEAWGKRGVAISLMNSLPATLYTGEIFDGNCAAVIPKNQEHLPAIWCFCSSPDFSEAVRRIDQKLNVTNATLMKVPFDIAYWQKVARERYPNGLPQPYSEDPTQWIFQGSVVSSTNPLHVGIARLLGYRWPAQEPDTLDSLSDGDGIVCIPSVRGEEPAADRLQTLLSKAYAEEWSMTTLDNLLRDVGCPGWNLDRWLREKFFEQHFALFHQRPFIWHIWDGKKDGFSALVNYHKLDRKLLETLTYDYLGADWIKRQLHDASHKVDGAQDRLDAARALQKSLEAILEGEAPYDIFVRWKPLYEQPIGWEPDLDDGVRLNIRPFVAAGVLRKEPKIKWDKDRGKDPEGSTWGEERINDRHLTLKEKRQARAAKNGHRSPIRPGSS